MRTSTCGICWVIISIKVTVVTEFVKVVTTRAVELASSFCRKNIITARVIVSPVLSDMFTMKGLVTGPVKKARRRQFVVERVVFSSMITIVWGRWSRSMTFMVSVLLFWFSRVVFIVLGARDISF